MRIIGAASLKKEFWTLHVCIHVPALVYCICTHAERHCIIAQVNGSTTVQGTGAAFLFVCVCVRVCVWGAALSLPTQRVLLGLTLQNQTQLQPVSTAPSPDGALTPLRGYAPCVDLGISTTCPWTSVFHAGIWSNCGPGLETLLPERMDL